MESVTNYAGLHYNFRFLLVFKVSYLLLIAFKNFVSLNKMPLELNIVTDKPVNCNNSENSFDERNGFATLVFGLDVHEDCELLQELEEILDFDLSLIKYPEGDLFEGFVDLNHFMHFIHAFKHQLENSRVCDQTAYPYISKEYLETGLLSDLTFFETFIKCALSQGAKGIKFEAR